MSTTEQRMRPIRLECREGASDKVYTLWLQEEPGDMWTVQVQYGPRAGWVQSARKTPQPVPLDKAEKVYERVLKEKLAKGYQPVDGAAPVFTQTAPPAQQQDTGLRLMLLTDASGEDPEPYLKSPDWGAQQKMNGKRIMLHAGGGKVVGVNRRGLECPIPQAVEKGLDPRRPLILDGELIGEVYHAFDMIERPTLGGAIDDLRGLGTAARHALLLQQGVWAQHITVIPLVTGEKAKRALFAKLQAEGQEGIVFKKLDAAYVPGRIENLKKATAVKLKFWKEMDCVVIGWTDKSSIEVGAYEKDKLVSVGKVTVPAKYAKQILVGGPVRVRYLYGTQPGRQLYQPNLDPTDDGRVMRTDVRPIDCTLDKMRFEGQSEEE